LTHLIEQQGDGTAGGFEAENLADEMGERSRLRSGGQVDTKVAEQNCSEPACDGAAATALEQQALCLNHFLLRCYARLEAVDPRGQKSRQERVDLAAMRAFIEECSRRALEISLQREDLSNLERARLLDILLWASELFLVLRAPRVASAESSGPPNPFGAKRLASRRF
jgi:hypothetical protein